MKISTIMITCALVLGSVSYGQLGTLISNKVQKSKEAKETKATESNNATGNATGLSEEEFWKAPTKNQQETLAELLKNSSDLKVFEFHKATSGKNYGKGYLYYEDLTATIGSEHASEEDYKNGNKFEICFNPSLKETFSANHASSSYFMGTSFLSEKYEDGTYLAQSYTRKLVVFDNFIVVFSSFSRNSTSFTIERIEYVIADKSNRKFVENAIESEALLAKVNGMMSPYYLSMRSGVKDAADKAAKEKYDKYGLKGKDVKSIAVEWDANNKYVLNQPVFFTIKTTLANGTVISSNDGFWDDYIITVTGGENKGGAAVSLSIDHEKLDPSDKVTVTVKSKYHPNVAAATVSHALNYAEGFTFSFNGYNGNSTANPRRQAGNVRIEVKAVKHAVTGENLYEYRVYNNNKHVHTVRMTTNKTCIVNANGYNGAKSGFGDQNGSAGGTITIIKDPSAKDAVFATSVNGGTHYSSGGRAANGTVTEKVQAVNW